MLRLHQKLAIRLFHGLNLLALWAMIGSGLQIYAANPVFGGRGGMTPPLLLRLGGWLAGGRHWHFFFMWVFALNLLAYGIYLLVSRHWQRRYASLQDLKALWLSRNPQRRTYAWHRLTLIFLILTLLLSLYTGLGMFKPVQFHWIVASLGNDWQALRVAHFLPVVLIPLLAWGHLRHILRLGGWLLAQSMFWDTFRSGRSPQGQTPAVIDKSEP